MKKSQVSTKNLEAAKRGTSIWDDVPFILPKTPHEMARNLCQQVSKVETFPFFGGVLLFGKAAFNI